MTEATKPATEAAIARVELAITIAAPPARVWKAMIEEIHEWWRRDFYAASGTQRFVLESRVGGRVYEDAGQGAGVLWFTVIGFDPPRSIHLAGHIAPPWGGPAVSLLNWTLEADGDRTVVRVSDSLIGRIDPSQMEEGWRLLFEEGLKPWVEKGRPV